MNDDEPDMMARLVELQAKADRGELTEEDREEIREMAVRMNKAMMPLVEATEEMLITTANAFSNAFEPMFETMEDSNERRN